MSVNAASDQANRDRIAVDLDSNLVVEAGAGTGKTHSFVSRIERLLLERKATIDQIAAITFTRAAAGELRERIRTRLEEVARSEDSSDSDRRTAEEALEGLDRAAIQTIHSFAESLVRERAVDAGLPLVIEPMDDVDATIAFDERWGGWIDGALDDPEIEPLISRAVRLGLVQPLDSLREIALAFHRDYDRIRDVDFSSSTREVRMAAGSVARAVGEFEQLIGYSKLVEEDRLYAHVLKVIDLGKALSGMDPDGDEALSVLARFGGVKFGLGRQGDWEVTPDGVNAAKLLKDRLAELDDEVAAELAQARSASVAPVLAAIRDFVLDYAAERRRSGRAEFTDLLVWAYDLLCGSANARRHFAERYTHILIDEFQDTDPLQLEIALLLAGAADPGGIREGALFVVGDPKQSIYRFRRADPRAIAGLPVRVGGDSVPLARTFRSHQAIVEWVNAIFGDWMGRDETPTQARYIDLETPVVAPSCEPAQGVYFAGGPMDAPNVRAVRLAEADRIARLAAAVGTGRWQVSDGKGGVKPSKFSDLCVLFPRRTDLDLMLRAFEDAGVPYTLEGQSLIFASQEVRDILAALTAIDDPTDEIAVVAALRSPLWGCSDVDLFRWREAGGRFNYLDRGIDDAGTVCVGLDSLRRLHEKRLKTPVPELIEELVTTRRLRHLAFGNRLGRERRRQIGVLLESARSLANTGRYSLREFLRWADERARARERFPEGGIADIGTDAVRLMTTYTAKGLEFPIVLLTALTTASGGRGGDTVLFDPSDPSKAAVKVGSGSGRFEFGEYEALNEAEKDADSDELVRVMYVGATRAKDYLVVSMFRRNDRNDSLAHRLAEYAEAENEHLWSEAPDHGEVEVPIEPSASEPWGSRDGLAEWERERADLLEARRRPAAVSATALKAATAGSPGPDSWDYRDEETKPVAPDVVTQPWQKGRGGTEVGRAVHAVLQDVDIETGEGVDALAARHAEAEGISDRAEEVAELASATLGAGVMRRAAGAKTVLREAYVAVPVGAGGRTALEGFVDLMFEDENGDLVVVDYKTDQVGESGSLESAAAAYEVQLGAYAYAIEESTGRRVSEAWLVFSRRALAGGEAGYRLPDLDGARREALERAREAVGV